MTSWRHTVSQQAQDDLDGLLDALLSAAQEFLEKQGEFYPFGMIVTATGESSLLAADSGLGEQPPSQSMLDLLIESLVLRRDELRAYALAYDVRLPEEKTDAICVDLEHREGVGIRTPLAYTKRKFGRGITYGSLPARRGPRRVWLPDR